MTSPMLCAYMAYGPIGAADGLDHTPVATGASSSERRVNGINEAAIIAQAALTILGQ